MATKLPPIQIPATPARTLYPELADARITFFAEYGQEASVDIISQRLDRDEAGAVVQAQPMDAGQLLRFTLADFVRLVPEMAHIPSDLAKGIELMRQRQAEEMVGGPVTFAFDDASKTLEIVEQPSVAVATTVVTDDTTAKDTP